MSSGQEDMENCSNESNPNGEEPSSPAAHRPLVSDESESSDHIHFDAEEVIEPEDIPTPTEERQLRFNVKIRLYQAALKGDWKTAKSIFDENQSNITMKITDAADTALHIAAAAKHISFVEKLVQLSSPSDLAAKNDNGYTAFAFAAASGVVRIAKVMVDKNPHLPNLYGFYKQTPLAMAVGYRHKDMASFLFSKTTFEALDNDQQIELLVATISSEYYDIALDILNKKPQLALERMENGDTALHVLARKPSAIGSSNELSFLKRSINSCNTSTLLSFEYGFHGIYHEDLMQTLARQIVERLWNFVVHKLTTLELHMFIRSPSRLLHEAARVGNTEFLIILIRSYPDFLWKVDDDDQSIFHIAVKNRQENVFSLIHEIGVYKSFLANYYDKRKKFNILHLAGLLAAPEHLNKVSGVALQMRRELLWFKEVEKVVVSSHLQMRCGEEPWSFGVEGVEIVQDPFDKLTPHELFTKEHKQLLKHSEEWMKNTANSCMLVATLIATVVFAAAFTVPGGNDDKEGIPIFRQNQAFTVFVISDVLALVSSTTSILTFLSILTSRYAEKDFLVSLPRKLLFGLVTLFVSIACMLVAFSATFFIAYNKTKAKIPLAIATIAMVPVGFFCVFQSKLVVDIWRSIYSSKFSLRHHKKRLF